MSRFAFLPFDIFTLIRMVDESLGYLPTTIFRCLFWTAVIWCLLWSAVQSFASKLDFCFFLLSLVRICWNHVIWLLLRTCRFDFPPRNCYLSVILVFTVRFDAKFIFINLFVYILRAQVLPTQIASPAFWNICLLKWKDIEKKKKKWPNTICVHTVTISGVSLKSQDTMAGSQFMIIVKPTLFPRSFFLLFSRLPPLSCSPLFPFLTPFLTLSISDYTYFFYFVFFIALLFL